MRALARRDYSAQGLAARLARAGVGEDERAEAIEQLAEAGYLDDGRFALARARTLSERGQGDAAIRYDLLERQGVGAEAVEAAIGALEPEVERARRVAVRLGSAAAAARALARRGFSDDAVDLALRDVARDEDAAVG